jgi:hypothetical protein
MHTINEYKQVRAMKLNGQQRSALNIATFLSWMDGKTDDDFRKLVVRGKLLRREIARECGFDKSVLLTNPLVKEAFQMLVARLRERKGAKL